jgi:hypothetical protein
MPTVRDAIPKAHALATAEFATLRLRLLKLGEIAIALADRASAHIKRLARCFQPNPLAGAHNQHTDDSPLLKLIRNTT